MSGESLQEPLLPPASEVADLVVRLATSHADASDSNPVLCAYRFDRAGACCSASSTGVRARRVRSLTACSLLAGNATVLHPRVALDALRRPERSQLNAEGGWLWFHLKRGHPALSSCLSSVPSLPEDATYELTAEDETQPRCTALPGRNLLLRLRGLRRRKTPLRLPKGEEGEEPTQPVHGHEDDLFSFTMLLRPDSILSSADASVDAITAMRKRAADCMKAGEGSFTSPGSFVAQLVENVIGGALELVHNLQDELDELEEFVEDATVTARSVRHGRRAQTTQDQTVSQLGLHRRTAVKLRRWIWPQRAVVKDLQLKGALWLFAEADEAARQQQRENVESTLYLLEALENIREHSSVLKDELAGLYQMRTSHALYILSMVSALFLPFTFVTGLLSMYMCVSAAHVCVLVLG